MFVSVLRDFVSQVGVITDTRSYGVKGTINMAYTYKTQGTLALKPVVSQNTSAVIDFPDHSWRLEKHDPKAIAHSAKLSESIDCLDVVSILSCFEGVPFAKTARDRKYAIVAGIISTLSLFVLSFGGLL